MEIPLKYVELLLHEPIKYLNYGNTMLLGLPSEVWSISISLKSAYEISTHNNTREMKQKEVKFWTKDIMLVCHAVKDQFRLRHVL